MFVLRYVFGNDRHQNVAEVYSASRLVFGWLPFKNYNTIFGVRFAGLFATLTVRQFCFRRARGSFMSFHAGRLIFSHKLSSTPTRASFDFAGRFPNQLVLNHVSMCEILGLIKKLDEFKL